MAFAAQHIRAARLHLQKADPVMKTIIRQVGPFTAKTMPDRFLTLVRSIVSQQISGAAARTILGRLDDLVAPDKVNPESLVKHSIDQLRAIGVSRQKASYVLDLAEQVVSGNVNLQSLSRKDNEMVIAELIQVKGIGVWTAQMFLMFSLGRLDVLPVGDLGIQNAIKKQYKPRGELTTKKIVKIAQPWQPYSTVACWYLWQSLNTDSK